ncbi:MAG: hypothetical protein GX589_00700 [Deltaproteobacteria bacterium]|nr:hypothetical protein [Deltaproteobacteria bacterium]
MRVLISKGLIVGLTSLLLSGCFRITYIASAGTGETHRRAHWNHYFVAGLIPVQEKYTPEELCPLSELIEVRTMQTPANVVASLLGFLNSANTLESVCLETARHPAAPSVLSEKTLGTGFFK